MISLLIDIHKGESYVEMNSGKYYNDSLKKMFKQSVLFKHNVSQEKFDTSLVWYGHHIDEYVKIYDEVISNLEAQDKEILAEARKEGLGAPLAAGDSVDMWEKPKLRILSKVISDSLMTFDLVADNNFKKGDNFNWSFRVMNSDIPIDIFVAADYVDGSKGYISKQESSNGWNTIKFQSDSTKAINRIYGIASYKPKNREQIFIDSIQLVRTRLNPSRYYMMNQQKKVKNKGFKLELVEDSIN